MKSQLKLCALLLFGVWWIGPQLYWDITRSIEEAEWLAECARDVEASAIAGSPTEAQRKSKIRSQLESLLLDPVFRLLAFSILKYRNSTTDLPLSLENLDLDGKVRLDPWERQIVYKRIDKETFILCSLGSDGVRGGESEASDRAQKYSTAVMYRAISDNPLYRWWYSPLTGR